MSIHTGCHPSPYHSSPCHVVYCYARDSGFVYFKSDSGLAFVTPVFTFHSRMVQSSEPVNKERFMAAHTDSTASVCPVKVWCRSPEFTSQLPAVKSSEPEYTVEPLTHTCEGHSSSTLLSSTQLSGAWLEQDMICAAVPSTPVRQQWSQGAIQNPTCRIETEQVQAAPHRINSASVALEAAKERPML